MFNSYIHGKLQKKEREKLNDIQKSTRLLDLYQKNREKLLKKYKIRIAKKVVDLVSDPVPVYNRDISASPKYLGESIMRIRPRDTKARVSDAIAQNVIYDSEPLNFSHVEFRTRHKEKEIQVRMKFKPKDRYERIVDTYFSDNSIISTWDINKSSPVPVRNKIKKLYYKTLESVALNVSPESCSQENSKALLYKISEDKISEDNLNKESLGILAQNALERCKLKPSKEFRHQSVKNRLN